MEISHRAPWGKKDFWAQKQRKKTENLFAGALLWIAQAHGLWGN